MSKVMAWLGGLFLISATMTAHAVGPNPWANWKTSDTTHFIVHYEAKDRAQAEALAAIAEDVYPKVTSAFSWEPVAKTEIVLLDVFDVANGFATPLPFNHTGIFLAPPDEGELLEDSDWYRLVFTHEFTHIVHLDKAAKAPKFMRHIFGRLMWLFPNALEPTWAIEGLATWDESDAATGTGRLGNSYYDTLMRLEVAHGLKSLAEINADGRAWPLSKSYLYGSYFYQFLEQQYGRQAVFKYVDNYSDNLLPFRVHTNPVAVTGKTMDVLWQQYEQWLQKKFGEQTAALNATPEHLGQRITMGDWDVEAPAQARDGTLYYVHSDGYHHTRLHRVNVNGADDTVASVQSGSRVSVAADGSLLIAQPDICDNDNYYFDLYRWSERSGMDRLTHCGRYRSAVMTPDKLHLIALHMASGQFRIDSLSSSGAFEKTLYQATAEEVITGIDVASDGRNILFTSKLHGQWQLRELNRADASVVSLLNDNTIKTSAHYSDDATSIVFIADYDHQFSAWQWQRGSHELQKLTQSYSGVLEISGLGPQGIRGLVVMTSDGKAIYQMNQVSSVQTREAHNDSAAPGAPAKPVALQNDRRYSAFASIAPTSWFPSGYAADGATAYGAQIYGEDTLGVHQYMANPMYETSQHEWLGYFLYGFNSRHFLSTIKTMEVLDHHKDQDKNSEVDTYKTRQTTQWISTQPWWSLDHRFTAGIGGAWDKEIYHDTNSQIQTEIGNEKVGGLYFSYDSRREYIRSEGETDGQLILLQAESYKVFGGQSYDGNHYHLEWRGNLGLGPTVLAGRLLAIRAEHNTEATELGGALSEPYYGVPMFDQRRFSLRGYAHGERELTGHDINLGAVEWRIPIADIDRHAMVPPFGLNRISATVFYERGAAFERHPQLNESSDVHYYSSTGVEMLAEIKIGYRFGLQLRLGYAKGLDERLGEDDFYASLGRSF